MAEFRNLGRFLKEARMNAGYTQSGLASKLGDVHSQFVSNWERGLCAPPSHRFHELISILKINRSKLVEVMTEDAKIEISLKVYPNKKKRSGPSSSS